MNVVVGNSARWGYGSPSAPAPVHLVVEVGGRKILACTGGAVQEPRDVAFDQVLSELDCGPCRKFWTRVMKVERYVAEEQPSTPNR